MEVSIFNKPEMRRVLNQFVEMRLHVDGKDEALAETFRRYQNALLKNPALPGYAIIEPDDPDRVLGKFLGADVLSGGSKFKKFLEDYLAIRG